MNIITYNEMLSTFFSVDRTKFYVIIEWVIKMETLELSLLDKYGEDYTKKTYITDPAIARDEEIKQAMLVLLTPDKSAILVGKPGIGKTAIVEGIAYRIEKGMVPDVLKDMRVIKISVSSIMGTAVSEGVLEQRLEILVKEIKEAGKGKLIIFIDEIHLLINKNANNSMDFANMLKPALDRGDVKMIGATTTQEYEQYILRDRAFNRRFQKIDIEETNLEDTVKIMMGSYPRYEAQTGIKFDYTDFVKGRIMKFLVEMTTEYNRVYEVAARYPDVCLTLLANAFSYALFENEKTIKMKHIYKAVLNARSIYEDAKKKEIERFKVVFKDLLDEEKVNLDEI